MADEEKVQRYSKVDGLPLDGGSLVEHADFARVARERDHLRGEFAVALEELEGVIDERDELDRDFTEEREIMRGVFQKKHELHTENAALKEEVEALRKSAGFFLSAARSGETLERGHCEGCDEALAVIDAARSAAGGEGE